MAVGFPGDTGGPQAVPYSWGEAADLFRPVRATFSTKKDHVWPNNITQGLQGYRWLPLRRPFL